MPESDCGPSNMAPCFLASVIQPLNGDVSASIDTTNAPGTAFYSENGTPRTIGTEFSISAPFDCPDFRGATCVTWRPFLPLTSLANGLDVHTGFSTTTSASNLEFLPKFPTTAASAEGGGMMMSHSLPVISPMADTSSEGARQFLILTDTVMTAVEGGAVVGEWFEFPISLAGAQLTLSNPAGQSEVLSNVEFFLDATQIPLDQLNNQHLPPSDPRFQSVPGIPNGTVLGPGGSVSFSVVPEPASATVLVTGLLGLFGYGALRLKRCRAHSGCLVSRRASRALLSATRSGWASAWTGLRPSDKVRLLMDGVAEVPANARPRGSDILLTRSL